FQTPFNLSWLKRFLIGKLSLLMMVPRMAPPASSRHSWREIIASASLSSRISARAGREIRESGWLVLAGCFSWILTIGFCHGTLNVWLALSRMTPHWMRLIAAGPTSHLMVNRYLSPSERKQATSLPSMLNIVFLLYIPTLSGGRWLNRPMDSNCLC